MPPRAKSRSPSPGKAGNKNPKAMLNTDQAVISLLDSAVRDFLPPVEVGLHMDEMIIQDFFGAESLTQEVVDEFNRDGALQALVEELEKNKLYLTRSEVFWSPGIRAENVKTIIENFEKEAPGFRNRMKQKGKV